MGAHTTRHTGAPYVSFLRPLRVIPAKAGIQRGGADGRGYHVPETSHDSERCTGKGGTGMCKMSLERMGGLALIVGPVLAFVMFLLQPGGILIDTAAPSDPIAAINALADNQNLASATVSLVCVGLVLMAFGLYALQATLRRMGAGDALSRAGLAFIVIGLITWFIAQGLALAIAIGLEDETANFLTPLVVARVAITIIGGMATALGFFLFALALTATNLGNVWVNRLVAALSLVSLGSFYWAASVGGDLDQGLALARSLYILWVIWLVFLGIRLIKEESPSSG